MWQKLIILILIFSISPFVRGHRLNDLTKNYPHGLLTNDFGILNEEDLKINACSAAPTPLTEPLGRISYSYWQCFELVAAKMICEGNKYDPHEKSRMSLIVISGVRNGELHEFIARRPLPLRSCVLYKKDWKRYTRGQSHVCVSGSPILKKAKNNMTTWVWIFDRYKTRTGCDSYFSGECDLKTSLSGRQCLADEP